MEAMHHGDGVDASSKVLHLTGFFFSPKSGSKTKSTTYRFFIYKHLSMVLAAR